MSSEVWRSSDLFNLLRSLYAAKIAAVQAGSAAEGPDPLTSRPSFFYQQGCQMAVQALLLAFGHSPPDFYQAEPDETMRRGYGRELWMRADLANLIVSLYDAFTSRTDWRAEESEFEASVWQMRNAGFYDFFVQLLQALGISATALDRSGWPTHDSLPRFWVEENADED